VPSVNPFAGPGFESAVESIKGMGFPEGEIRTALMAAFGNPDRAVEYLMSGIPDGAIAQVRAMAARGQAGAAPGSGAPAVGGVPATGIDALRSHPQFNEMKRVIQSNPGALNQVLAAIGSQSPTLLQDITANQAAFIAMMQESINEDDEGAGDDEGDEGMVDLEGEEGMDEDGEMMGGMDPNMVAQLMATLAQATPEQRAQLAAQMGIPPEQLAQMAAAIGQGGMGGGPGGPGGRVVRIELTEADAAAVARLEAMGFPRDAVVQAYVACDKNEEAAANYLLENGFD
jgi:UV excision repair protein RAD23